MTERQEHVKLNESNLFVSLKSLRFFLILDYFFSQTYFGNALTNSLTISTMKKKGFY